MKNQISTGISMNVVAPSGGLVSGAPYVVGGKLTVCVASGAEGVTIAVNNLGVYELAKAAGAIGQGAIVYYDETAEDITTTASGNVFAGFAHEAELTGATTVKVNINPNASALVQVANVADEDTADGSDAATTQALANALKAKVNELLAAIKAAGVMVDD